MGREVEPLAAGEDTVAELEDLGVGVVAFDRDADDVGRADRAAGDALALEQRADRGEPVAEGGGALELVRARGLLHPPLEVGFDLCVAAREEPDDAIDPAPVLLGADVAHTGCRAAFDVVIEARNPRAPARLGAFAGAELEQLAEHLERLANALRAGVGTEVGAAGPVTLAGDVDPRIGLVERDRDVGIGLVVAQPDVELRPVALDELLLGEQRLGLGRGDDELDVGNLVAERARGCPSLGEMRGDPLANRVRLADVEDLAGAITEQVDARGVGQGGALFFDPRHSGPTG